MKLDIEKLKNDGFFVIYNFLSSSEKETIINSLVPIFCEYLDESCLHNLNGGSYIDNQNFHDELIKLRKVSPNLFSDSYDKLILSASIRSVFYSKKFINIFSQILGVEESKVFLNGVMLRLDVPHDSRNTLNWHQDSAYYMQTFPGFNAYVCWLPLISVNENNGSIKYVKKSHKQGFNIKKLKINHDITVSTQQDLFVSKDIKTNTFVAEFGDFGLFHMNIFHRSGVNSSKKVRLSLGVRCHDMGPKFNIGKENFEYKYLDSKN